MKGQLHSYKDDLESLAYVLIYAKLGKLPWQKHRKIKVIGKDFRVINKVLHIHKLT